MIPSNQHRIVYSGATGVVVFVLVILLSNSGSSVTTAQETQASGAKSSNTALTVTPLKRRIQVPADAPEPEWVQSPDVKMIPGISQSYSFPPSGYVPDLPDTESRLGANLYGSSNCANCHSVDGKGGQLGPPLDGIGGHRGKEFLIARILDPEDQVHNYPDIFGPKLTRMPHPAVTVEQAEKIAAFLLTLPEPEGGFQVTSHPKIDLASIPGPESPFIPAIPDELSDKGMVYFLVKGCAACHSVQGQGGTFAPDLDGVGSRRSRQQLRAILAGAVKDLPMPDQKLSSAEFESIIDFLMTLSPATSKSAP